MSTPIMPEDGDDDTAVPTVEVPAALPRRAPSKASAKRDLWDVDWDLANATVFDVMGRARGEVRPVSTAQNDLLDERLVLMAKRDAA